MVKMNEFFAFVKEHFEIFNKDVVPKLIGKIPLVSSQTKLSNVVPYNINYLDTRLQNKINQTTYWHTKYTLTFRNLPLTINICSPTKRKQQNNNVLYIVLFTIYYCQQVMSMRNFAMSNNTLTIDIVLSKYKKILTKSNMIDQYTVNSGVTSFDYSHQTVNILVFRREEVAKVLIHEIIHAMRVDDPKPAHVVSNSVSTFFGANMYLNINESFTEAYACMLNIALAALVQKKSALGFKQFFNVERTFIKNQAMNVLQRLDFQIPGGVLLPPKNYKEVTNVISYYVLKYILYENINVFCTFLQVGEYKLNDIDVYIDFIYNLLTKHKWISKSQIDNNDDTSLRMSVVDLVDILGGNQKAYKTFCI
jgi:hypothetical protein